MPFMVTFKCEAGHKQPIHYDAAPTRDMAEQWAILCVGGDTKSGFVRYAQHCGICEHEKKKSTLSYEIEEVP